jgi:hypothetical protein
MDDLSEICLELSTLDDAVLLNTIALKSTSLRPTPTWRGLWHPRFSSTDSSATGAWGV